MKEKIFYNAINMASTANYGFISSLKKAFHSWEDAYHNDRLEKINYPRIKKETFPNFIRNKKNIDPYKEWQRLKEKNIELILDEDERYPSLLKQIKNHPLGLYVSGKIDFSNPMFSIIGTRKCSQYGKIITEKLSHDILNCGFTIVSGLANGIDSLSHKSAIYWGGSTIAVLPSGLNEIFPENNRELANEIKEKNGMLISEYPLDFKAMHHCFLARNRIISGLSSGVLITEAPEKSGALITAKLALDQNREVFAIPGSILNESSRGCHQLIQEGAKLTTSIEDILKELNIGGKIYENYPTMTINDKENNQYKNLSEKEKTVMLLLSDNPGFKMTIDMITEKTNYQPSETNQIITLLEIKNLIINEGGKYGKIINHGH